ncbi:MAG: divalent-cation tolerance protein CutA [Puniceicoccales bacterium]|nr:divalent-cation tolerance protein CutA [Puniceicoccales bacterium]
MIACATLGDSMASGYAVVLTTVESRRRAEDLARRIVEEKLAACVQTYGVRSFYRWMGKVERGDEHLLIIKTTVDACAKLSEFIVANHGYKIPEIIQIPIIGGLPEYLHWIGVSSE